MSNPTKFSGSSSTPLLQENYEEPKSNAQSLPHQHGVTNPISPAPGRHGGVPHYSFNSEGYLTTNGVSTNAIKQSIKEPVILEIPDGFDVISSVVQFAQHVGRSVTVLTGDGLISAVDVAYPLAAIPPPCVSTIYQMISLSGTYHCLNAAAGEIISCFHVQFVDAAGNVMGGQIVSYMTAASAVTLVLAVAT